MEAMAEIFGHGIPDFFTKGFCIAKKQRIMTHENEMKREHVMDILIHGYSLQDAMEMTGLGKDEILGLLDMRDEFMIRRK